MKPLVFVFCVSAALLARAAEPRTLPFVSPMFGDNMMIQRGKTNTIWGWSRPGSKVQVSLGEQTSSGVAGADGRWQVRVMPPSNGGPYTLQIQGEQIRVFHNIIVGDVWLCGGQSNMEFPLSRSRDGEEEVKSANHSDIRLFTVKSQCAYEPAAVISGSWKVCSPKTATEDGGVSAVGYYFARAIQARTNVPVGLIKDCLGGTPAEAWTSLETIQGFKDFATALSEVQQLRAKGGTVYGNYIMPWYDEFDIGQKGRGWSEPGLDETSWKSVTIPGGFAELGVADTPSVCYFRRNITVPEALASSTAVIHLGVVERMDTTFINGHWVGASAWVENPRAYSIPEGVLKAGRNQITVRVFKLQAKGGFESKPEELFLSFGDSTKLPLAGEWKGKVSVDARPPHPLPLSFENWPVMPSVLYNGMLAPVAPLALGGAIWYQGEANTSRAAQYRALLPAMISDWRRAFGQGDFPFYIVSLPAFMAHRDKPGDDSWAELREALALTASRVPNSGLAVTIDTGDANDIHPKDKKVVGERLAFCALANYYGMRIPFAGPVFTTMERSPGALRLHFKNTDGGLVTKGGKLEEFSVADDTHKWCWATARIDGDSVIVSSDKVSNPTAARYAWQSNPQATLFNGAGLPAVPFRTDCP